MQLGHQDCCLWYPWQHDARIRLTPNIVEGGSTAPEITVDGLYWLCQWTDAGRQQGLADLQKPMVSPHPISLQCSYIAQCNNMGLTNQMNSCSSASDVALFHKDYEILRQ